MVNGLILAGGKSSRMGSDKSVIDYHGRPQREFIFDLLGKFCDRVFLSCKSTEGIPIRLNPLADQFSVESPLNGILSAFTIHPTTAWLTVAVDMPLIDEKAIRFLLDNRDHAKIATCFFDSDGKLPEPLFTVWEPRAHALLLKYFEQGNTGPRQFLKNNDVKIIPAPDTKILTNINSQDDYKELLGER